MKYTKIEEWGLNSDKLDKRLFHYVDLLVDEASRIVNEQVHVKIHYAWAKDGHVANSQHYLGKAVDLHLYTSNAPLSPAYQLIAAFKCPFTGIGVYPEWNNRGLHVDVRDLKDNEARKTWLQIKGQYLPLDAEHIKLLVTKL